MKSWVLISLLLLLTSNIFSSIIINDNCKNALKNIYELQFNCAEILINQENTDNRFRNYLNNNILFLKVLLNEKERDYTEYKSNFSESINLIEKENPETPEYYSVISEMYFHLAIIKFKMGETVSGSFNFYKSYRILLKGITKYKNDENLLKLFAFYKIIFGAIPDEYLWLTDFIGIKGDINTGVNFINLKYLKYINENSAKSIEYQVLRIIISDMFAEENTNNINIKQLNLENSLVRISYLVSLAHHGKSKLASEILCKYKQAEEYKIDYFDYLIGLTKLYKLDTNANIYLENFVNTFEGKNFIKTAYQKLSWYYLIYFNQEKYSKNIELTKSLGTSQFDADLQAINEINHYNRENVDLLKARLFFDGGYYKKSDSILNNNLSKKQLANYQDEILYRLARSAQKTDNKEVAIKYYNQLINQFNTQTNYYCAVAFMNLGIIYEETSNYKLSEDNYLLCLKSKNKLYKNSIEHKAKAGLNRIKGQLISD